MPGSKITSTIVNVVYARNYPVVGGPTLSTGAKAGIGVGAGVAGIAGIGFLLFLLTRWWRNRRRDSWYTPGGSVSPYDSQPP